MACNKELRIFTPPPPPGVLFFLLSGFYFFWIILIFIKISFVVLVIYLVAVAEDEPDIVQNLLVAAVLQAVQSGPGRV